MVTWNELVDICRKHLQYYRNGNKFVSYEAVLKNALREGYAQLGTHLPTGFYEVQSEDCKNRLVFLFSEIFLRKSTELESTHTLDQKSVDHARLQALVQAAMKFMSERYANEPCGDTDSDVYS
jgi:hypothetical protein